jgi:glyoxylase-like metal-dependent hydrolase (beta-lactamase superfamily II)
MNEFDFYSHKKINDRLYLVQECYLNPEHVFNIYVVIGNEKTGVFDAGLAATGGLRRYIESNITGKKPMVCYVTHQDLDHIGGAILFDEAYMNHRELPKLDWNLNVERRFSDLEVFCKGNKEVLDFCRDHYLHNENVHFNNVDEGDIIKLGGVTFDVLKMPIHSPGSLVYYNRAECYALSGDAIHHHNAFQRNRDPIAALNVMKHFTGMMSEDVKLYTGHEKEPLGIREAREIWAAWEEIISGKTEHDEKSKMPFSFVDPDELAYDVKLHRYGGVGILYDANTLKP